VRGTVTARLLRRLHGLPVRSKLGLTMVSGGFVVLAVVAFLSFGYWHDQLVSTVREQALVSATTAQATLRSALSRGDESAARQTLRQLSATQSVELVRVYAGGRVLLSSDPAEEGAPPPRGTWVPAPGELPADGVARTSDAGDVVTVYMPIRTAQPAVVELRYSMATLRAAMRRGMGMGVGLVLLGLLALGFLVAAMLEREVVGPLQRMGILLHDDASDGAARPRPGRDELQQIEASMVRLIRSRREVEARAAERDRELDRREGFAQVGELAAEMAHEFKRPLASIRSAMDLLEQEYVLDEGSRDVLESMHGQLERLSDTMKDLFSLARPATSERTPIDVCEVVDDALLGLGGHPALRGVETVRRYSPDLPRVPAEPRRIQQAVQNVVLNAAEAMPGGGRITITATAEAGRVSIGVHDTGLGMTDEAIQQALRPFHSTKPSGTGLGLPLVVRILAAHGGELAIDSTPGEGTTVWLGIPLGAGEPAARAPYQDTPRGEETWVSAS
jgi:signal transduction histidine kinase